MKNFKIEISRWNQKFQLYKKAENELFLREELHKEWFSILSIETIDDISVSWEKFFFEIFKDWNLKTWTIFSNDIFKAYLKIKEELKYDLKFIYKNQESSLEEKEKIIKDLNEKYYFYNTSNKKEIQKNQNEELKFENISVEVNFDNFQMKKELDETYKIIEKVLLKLKSILELEENEYLNYEKREKLKDIYNLIIKLKTSTNIVKLKQIWEIALSKIWEIELYLIEVKKQIETKELLKETNKLLKQVWSKKTFIEKDKDLNYILNNFFINVLNFFKFLFEKKEKNKKIEIDKKTYIFIKNTTLYSKYNQKLKDINLEILKNIIIFIIPTKKNIELKDNLTIKRKVILQNKKILQKRITWKSYSYVKLKKWYEYFLDKFHEYLKVFSNSFFLIIFIYSIFFITYLSLKNLWIINFEININWIFYLIYLIIWFILLNLSRNILLFIFNIVFLNFLFIFWVINI